MPEIPPPVSGRPIDPASVPQHVVEAAARIHADWEGEDMWKESIREQAAQMIAAALAALMDDKEVHVWSDSHTGYSWVRPSDVLMTVLAR